MKTSSCSMTLVVASGIQAITRWVTNAAVRSSTPPTGSSKHTVGRSALRNVWASRSATHFRVGTASSASLTTVASISSTTPSSATSPAGSEPQERLVRRLQQGWRQLGGDHHAHRELQAHRHQPAHLADRDALQPRRWPPGIADRRCSCHTLTWHKNSAYAFYI